jgi:hypothetical protein
LGQLLIVPEPSNLAHALVLEQIGFLWVVNSQQLYPVQLSDNFLTLLLPFADELFGLQFLF